MATLKMTFLLPEDLAKQFAHHVPARRRSRYLADALREKLLERDPLLVQACKIANDDPDIRAIEKDFDAVTGETHSAAFWNCD